MLTQHILLYESMRFLLGSSLYDQKQTTGLALLPVDNYGYDNDGYEDYGYGYGLLSLSTTGRLLLL